MPRELKEIAGEIRIFFEVKNIEELPTILKNVLFSDNCTNIFDKYINIVGDLETDYLQKSYQFWLADRGKGSKQQDFTPYSVAKLVAELATCPSGGTVYDCCAGSGALTIAKHKTDNSLKFVCEELDENVIPLLLFNLAIRGIEAIVIHGDVLKNVFFHVYKLQKYGKYSKVIEISINDYTLEEYDVCISNPPYNITWEPSVQDVRFMKNGTPPKSNANFAFALHCLYHLKEGGKVTLILPTGIMSSSVEAPIRVALSKAGIVDSIVALPGKMFESTDIPVCVITLRKGNAKTPASMIDARKTFHEEVRHQRGEGDRSHTERVYHKVIKVLSDDDISKITKAINGRDNVPGFAASTIIEDFIAREFMWNVQRYIVPISECSKHRPYGDIVRDLRYVAKDKSRVKLTINLKMAEALGIDIETLAKANDAAMENTRQINGFLTKILGLEPIEEKPYLRISKNAGEIKIENTDKDGFSSLFAIFMPMFKQRIYALNQRENELLAEFRDALLPDLMSGTLDISTL